MISSCWCDAPSRTDAMLGTRSGYTMVQCTACGTARTLEWPDAVATQYVEGTYHLDRRAATHTPMAYHERFDHDFLVSMQRARTIERARPPQRLLDVGCANGGFLAWARTAGYDATGLELGTRMADWAHRRTGATVVTSWDALTPGFDLITYFDVIEHVADPVAELERCWSYLRPGGRLLLDTPDAGAFPSDFVSSHHVKPREHLWYFDEHRLRMVCERVGFTVCGVERPIPGKLVVIAEKPIR